MQLGILGNLSVEGAGGDAVEVRGAKLRALLADLVIHVGETVPAGQLIEDLWGDEPPRDGANALQAQVSKLRRALPDGAGLVVTRATGYALAVEADTVDAVRFERLAAGARRALTAGDPATAAAGFRAALGLWRGPALDEFRYEEFARLEAARLDESRLAAVEGRLDAELLLGRHAELVPELEDRVARHPLRERFAGQLMTALYRAGRQAEALRTYTAVRAALADELGIDVSPELQRLEAMILAQDPALAPSPVAAVTPAAPPDRSVTSNLRADLTAFIGRRQELAAVDALLTTDRLVTMVGPGGAGKTRLAVEAARRAGAAHPDGVWLVELAPVADPSRLAATVAAALGLQGVEGPGAGGNALDGVAGYLAPRRALLVLDNCEHVVAEAATVAADLLGRCARLTVLATSREGLGVPGETLWPVPPLAGADARDLFERRARAAAPAFTVTAGGEEAVAEICARLDGMPLAIELAAARTRAFAVTEIAARLDDRFRLLTGGARTALPRQQTLRAVVDWSYDLLFEDERRVFERLSAFVGGFTLAAAAEVCGDERLDPPDVEDIVLRLVDKSLVVAEPRDDTVRYRLLQTLAHYGRERLADGDGAARARARHAAWYGALAAEADPHLRADGQRRWIGRLDAELDNLRAAIDWALAGDDPARALTVVSDLGTFWMLTGRIAEGWDWARRSFALPGVDAVGDEVLVRGHLWAGFLGVFSPGADGTAEALAHTVSGVAGARQLGDGPLLGLALLFDARQRSIGGQVDETIALATESRRLLGAAGDRWGEGMARYTLGEVRLRTGRAAEAEVELRAAEAAFREVGDEWALAMTLAQLSQPAQLRGDFREAIRHLEEAVAHVTAMGSSAFAAALSARLGLVHVIVGEYDQARAILMAATAAAEERGMLPALGFVAIGRGLLHRRVGELDEATAVLERGIAVFTEMAAPSGRAFCWVQLGYVAEARGEVAGADRCHRRGLAAAIPTGDLRAVALAVEGLAGAAASAGDAEGAAVRLGLADGLRRRAGPPLPEIERIDIERAAAAALATLGPEGFAAAFAAGGAGAGEPEAVLASLAEDGADPV